MDSHGHDHAHTHTPKNFGPMFAIATALNVALVAVQVFYGIVAHSVALLADAGHNFGDALGLVIAWGAHVLARLNPTARYTYGFRSASILAALLNGVILLVATGAIAWEAIGRFFEPSEVAGMTVMIVAAVGILINGLSAWLLMSGQKADLNIRGAFLHMVADAAVSLGVVIAGGLILLTGWNWLDPAVSIVISLVIVWGTWGLLREAINHSLDAVPAEIDPKEVSQFLERPTRRRKHPRSARVGNEHHRNGANVSPGYAGRSSRRHLFAKGLRSVASQIRNRASDNTNRACRCGGV